MNNKLIRVAFGSVPKDGGTFTFYHNMRSALWGYGIDLRCVTVGSREEKLVEKAYMDDGCVLLASGVSSIKKQSNIFAEWCEQEQIDIVMAINSVAILSSLPYLPKRIRVMSRCANAFDEGYRITMSGRERLMRIIALTPRLQKDLVEGYGADSEMIELIPNGIESKPFPNRELCEFGELRIQLGFLGRLEHKQKGVLYLPDIVKELKLLNVEFHLRIAGKGKHGTELKKLLKPYIDSGEVEFVGALTKDEVPIFLSETDIYLFTSHFEGCPNALLEAMMAGCVPVSFLIDGITDFIVAHGKTGFVAPMSDCKTFAGYVAKLGQDRDLLRQISEATAEDARRRFVSEVAAAQYARVFKEVMDAPLPKYEPLPWSKFRIDPVYRRDWSVKSVIGASVRRMKGKF